MLLTVGESTGSSPGRAGYKMAVAADGELCGSIGGGVMEVELVERSRAILSEPGEAATPLLIEQVHRKDVPNSSGMICSGRQTVIMNLLTPGDLARVEYVVASLKDHTGCLLIIDGSGLAAGPDMCGTRKFDPAYSGPVSFERTGDGFRYLEELGCREQLVIVGGGHCALALSELASRLGFHISIYDDRPALNTIEKNEFADEINVIGNYDEIAAHVPDGDEVYVVVMTLGYKSDAVVIRRLIDHRLKYFGVLGSKAKMATLMKELRDEGVAADKLARIRTPIGLPINSRTPEEIAVSIAAEMIKIRNQGGGTGR